MLGRAKGGWQEQVLWAEMRPGRVLGAKHVEHRARNQAHACIGKHMYSRENVAVNGLNPKTPAPQSVVCGKDGAHGGRGHPQTHHGLCVSACHEGTN